MMRRKPDRPRHGGTCLEQCELDIRKYHTDNHLFTKRPSFGLQNTASCTIKGGLSQRERPPFRTAMGSIRKKKNRISLCGRYGFVIKTP